MKYQTCVESPNIFITNRQYQYLMKCRNTLKELDKITKKITPKEYGEYLQLKKNKNKKK